MRGWTKKRKQTKNHSCEAGLRKGNKQKITLEQSIKITRPDDGQKTLVHCHGTRRTGTGQRETRTIYTHTQLKDTGGNNQGGDM